VSILILKFIAPISPRTTEFLLDLYKLELNHKFIFQDFIRDNLNVLPPERQINLGNLVVHIFTIFFIFLVYIPRRVGRFISKRYYREQGEDNDLITALKVVRNEVAPSLEHLSKRKDSWIAEYFVSIANKLLKFALFLAHLQYYYSISLNIVLRYLHLDKILKFFGDNLTRPSYSELLEQLKGTFHFAVVDITLSDNKMVTGIMVDYGINEGEITNFVLEKPLRWEKRQEAKHVEFEQNNLKISTQRSLKVVSIPGDRFLIPKHSIIDVNLRKVPRERIVCLHITKFPLGKLKHLNSEPLDEDDYKFIYRLLENEIKETCSNRFVFSKFTFFYDQLYENVFERILKEITVNNNLEWMHFIESFSHKIPELDPKLINDFYTFNEVKNYKKDLFAVIIPDEKSGEIIRKVI
jgi:hypothetical protein